MSAESRVELLTRIYRLLPLILTAAAFLLPIGFVELNAGWQALLGTVGSAFIVVFVLGCTVDWWLKMSIVEDVFRIAIGHMLPEELKPEMEWVYRQNVIALEHAQVCQCKELDDEHLAFHVTVNRKFRNVSQAPIDVPIHISTDEWFHEIGKSQILGIGYTAPNGGRSLYGADIQCTKDKAAIKYELDCVSLAPNAEIEVWYEFEEVKHFNDEHHISFECPTRNPTVTIFPCDGVDVRVNFAHRAQPPTISMGRRTHTLHGTLLPGQYITVRWWRTEDSEKWVVSEKQ